MASTITYNKWDTKPIVTKTSDNHVGLPQQLDFKQSWSYWTRGWVIPKVRENGKAWRAVSDKLILEVCKHRGLLFAIYRIHNRINRLHDQYGRKIWTVSEIKPEKIVIQNKRLGIPLRYTVISFSAKRNPLDMTGGV